MEQSVLKILYLTVSNHFRNISIFSLLLSSLIIFFVAQDISSILISDFEQLFTKYFDICLSVSSISYFITLIDNVVVVSRNEFLVSYKIEINV